MIAVSTEEIYYTMVLSDHCPKHGSRRSLKALGPAGPVRDWRGDAFLNIVGSFAHKTRPAA